MYFKVTLTEKMTQFKEKGYIKQRSMTRLPIFLASVTILLRPDLTLTPFFDL